MIYTNNIKIAFDSLKNTRGRTYLTMLGVIIGVASICLILILGASVKQALGKKAADLGKNIIVVRPGNEQTGAFNAKSIFNYSPLAGYATTTLSEQDLSRLSKQPQIKHQAPLMLINGNVSAKNQLAESAILATNSDFASIMNLSAGQGQFIDGKTDRDTTVIGQQLAIDLFGSDQAVGQQLKIRGRTHTVIGVLKHSQGPVGINGIDVNKAAIITLESGKTFNQGIAQIQQINLALKDDVDPAEATAAIAGVLRKSHDGQRDFSLLSGQDASAISKNFYDTITALSTIVASISLIVGGIGIMNIMLVGVAERTKEIGIRKSLGASDTHILWQFLIEALMISVTGGLIGIVVAYITAAVIGLLIGFTPVIAASTIAIGFGVSLAVGVVFGITPAFRAARKDPIESLRQQN